MLRQHRAHTCLHRHNPVLRTLIAQYNQLMLQYCMYHNTAVKEQLKQRTQALRQSQLGQLHIPSSNKNTLYDAIKNIDKYSQQDGNSTSRFDKHMQQNTFDTRSPFKYDGNTTSQSFATASIRDRMDRIKSNNISLHSMYASHRLPSTVQTFQDLMNHSTDQIAEYEKNRIHKLSLFSMNTPTLQTPEQGRDRITDMLKEAVHDAAPSPYTAALLAALRATTRKPTTPKYSPHNRNVRRNNIPGNMPQQQYQQQQNIQPRANRMRFTPQPTEQKSTAELQHKQQQAEQKQRQIHINARQTIAHLSQVMKISTDVIFHQLRQLEHPARTPKDYIDADVADIVVRECGFEPIKQQSALQQLKAKSQHTNATELPRRGPVVCVAGHVDHGKTTLLDALRHSNVAASEAGGITQSIGAFSVDLSINNDNSAGLSEEDKIAAQATFLDTPGHAAFKNMRERGISSSCVDMLVLVVSAVDGIQPQTIEAIRLALNNNVPIVVAINKCDLYGADSEKIQLELLKFDIVTEMHGGDVQCVNISALQRTGLDELKESLLLTAEMCDLRCARDIGAQCYVVESKIDRYNGIVLNIVVRSGILKVGDIVVSGIQKAKIRALINENNQRVQAVGPSTGVQILGFESLDGIDNECMVVDSDTLAEQIIADRIRIAENESAAEFDAHVAEHGLQPAVNKTERLYRVGTKTNRKHGITTTTATAESRQAEEAKEATNLNLIVKSDVAGSLEALLQYIELLETCSNEVTATVIKSGLGEITETDLMLAQQSNASIVVFNVPINARLDPMVKSMKLNVVSDSIIYNLMDAIAAQLSQKLPPLVQQNVVATVDVAAVFDLKGKRGSSIRAAGCKVLTGEINVKHKLKVIRDGVVVKENGIIDSLKHFKDEVSTVKKEQECGIVIRGWNEWQVGDEIQCIATSVTKRVFNDELARGTIPNKSNEQQFANTVYKKQQYAN